MGYTHYWCIKEDTKEENYKEALEDCIKIVESTQKTYNLCNAFGEENTEPQLIGGIRFNGCEKKACETFHIGEMVEDNEADFCKTRGNDYDIVVTACLIALKDRLGDSIKVSSDGRLIDWNDGIKLASIILNRELTFSLD